MSDERLYVLKHFNNLLSSTLILMCHQVNIRVINVPLGTQVNTNIKLKLRSK